MDLFYFAWAKHKRCKQVYWPIMVCPLQEVLFKYFFQAMDLKKERQPKSHLSKKITLSLYYKSP